MENTTDPADIAFLTRVNGIVVGAANDLPSLVDTALRAPVAWRDAIATAGHNAFVKRSSERALAGCVNDLLMRRGCL